MNTEPGLGWVHHRQLAYSDDGQHVIVPQVLPDPHRGHPAGGPGDRKVFVLRKLGKPRNTYDPACGRIGVAIAEEYSLSAAQQAAERDTSHDTPDRAPEYPAPDACRFWRPVPHLPTLGALAVIREGDRLLAQVLSMEPGKHRYHMRVQAELDVTAATRSSLRRAWYNLRHRSTIRARQEIIAHPSAATPFPPLDPDGITRDLSWERLCADMWRTHPVRSASLLRHAPGEMYVIMRRNLALSDDTNPVYVHVLRRIHPTALQAHGLSAIPGDFVSEHSSLDDAQRAADEHLAHRIIRRSPDVPVDIVAVALHRFSWRVPGASGKYVLAVARTRGRVELQLGTPTRTADGHYDMHILATIDLTNLTTTQNTTRDPLDAECPSCLAPSGGAHTVRCPEARCPDCGRPRPTCRAHSPQRPALWHGEDQSTKIAQQQCWLLKPGQPGHPHYIPTRVPDHHRVQLAAELGMLVWSPDRQCFFAIAVDNDELNRHLAESAHGASTS